MCVEFITVMVDKEMYQFFPREQKTGFLRTSHTTACPCMQNKLQKPFTNLPRQRADFEPGGAGRTSEVERSLIV